MIATSHLLLVLRLDLLRTIIASLFRNYWMFVFGFFEQCEVLLKLILVFRQEVFVEFLDFFG